MNYLLSFAHLLKWLFCPAPKPSMVGGVDVFAVPRDNGRDWEKKVQLSSNEGQFVVDTASSPPVAASETLQPLSPVLADEIKLQSASGAVTEPELATASVEFPEIAAVSPSELEPEIPQRPSSWVTVQLQQQVTLANLHELQQELQQLLGKRVQLSGSQVQRVDTAALQMLVAFMHSAEVSVCWIDHSPALRQAARLLGLSALLNLPE